MDIDILSQVDTKYLLRARKVYRGMNDSVYKLAAHEDEPDRLRIWRVYEWDGTAVLRDDDASHLAESEFEGVFEMRCDDMDLEAAQLMAELDAEFA